jgi:hypothetical protein
MQPEQLKAILDKHAAYLRGDPQGQRADLYGADLYGADLSGANLSGANLSGANLYGANLYGAKTDEKTTPPHFQIPQTGTLEVWKKLSNGAIAKLLLREKDKRTATPIGRKCRASACKVLAIFDGATGEPIKEGGSMYDHGKTVYKVGRIVKPDNYNDDWRVECTHGIHFFLTREEAVAYDY